MQTIATPIPGVQTSGHQTKAQLRELSRDLEAAFLTEMLQHAGLGETPESFGGGVGEDQFASLLRETQARSLVDSGGIGLAEAIFKSLEARNRG